MFDIYLIYKNKKIDCVASNTRMVTDLIKEKFNQEKDKINDIYIEQYSLNNMYNHSKINEYEINSNYELVSRRPN